MLFKSSARATKGKPPQQSQHYVNCGGGTWNTHWAACVFSAARRPVFDWWQASLRLAQSQPKATRWLSAGRKTALDKPKATTHANTFLPPTPITVQDRPRPQAWARREFIGQGDQKAKQKIKNRKTEKQRNTILQNSSSPSPALSLQREACGKTLVHFISQGYRKQQTMKN